MLNLVLSCFVIPAPVIWDFDLKENCIFPNCTKRCKLNLQTLIQILHTDIHSLIHIFAYTLDKVNFKHTFLCQILCKIVQSKELYFFIMFRKLDIFKDLAFDVILFLQNIRKGEIHLLYKYICIVISWNHKKMLTSGFYLDLRKKAVVLVRWYLFY